MSGLVKLAERAAYIEAASLKPHVELAANIIAALESDPPDGIQIKVDWPRFLVAVGWTPGHVVVDPFASEP